MKMERKKKVKHLPSTLIFKCEDWVAATVEAMAKDRGINKSKLIRELVTNQLDPKLVN